MSPVGGYTGQGADPGVNPGAAIEQYVPMPGFLRLDIELAGGDALLLITETIDRNGWPPDENESLLRKGFHSIPLVRRGYGYRLRPAGADAITANVRTIG